MKKTSTPSMRKEAEVLIRTNGLKIPLAVLVTLCTLIVVITISWASLRVQTLANATRIEQLTQKVDTNASSAKVEANTVTATDLQTAKELNECMGKIREDLARINTELEGVNKKLDKLDAKLERHVEK